METNQTKLWEGPFGDAYQERNKATEKELENRKEFWEAIFRLVYTTTGTVPKSVLEIGAGQGQNLIPIGHILKDMGVSYKLQATELNQKARIILADTSKEIEILPSIPDEPTADLVFTYGVMIHTHPGHIRDLQQKMYKASKNLVMCCEYFAPETRPMMYRGEKDALWLDDYGGHFVKNCALSVCAYGFSWKFMSGLDNVTFWVFQKKEKLG